MPIPETGLYILTGPVHSGKTTALMNWIKKRTDVYGILTPLVNEKRVFLDIQISEQFAMETAEYDSTILTVGRFKFSKKSFDRAIGIIRDAIYKKGWLIIDEIGPLELRGEGFHDVLKEVIVQRKDKLLLVVREELIEKVKKYFELNAFEIKPGDFSTLL
jgi:nucleoside-triphosphatase THEP1